MSIGPIGGSIPLTQLPTPPRPSDAPAPGFAQMVGDSLQQISALEHNADALIQDAATGGPTKIHEVMIATTEASLAVDMLVTVRDRALEAYNEIMRLQL